MYNDLLFIIVSSSCRNYRKTILFQFCGLFVQLKLAFDIDIFCFCFVFELKFKIKKNNI